jgi:hypothetical protein
LAHIENAAPVDPAHGAGGAQMPPAADHLGEGVHTVGSVTKNRGVGRPSTVPKLHRLRISNHTATGGDRTKGFPSF